MSDSAFVVVGRTDCLKDWDVQVFSTDSEAKAFAQRLNAWCKAHDCDTDPESQERRRKQAQDREETFKLAWWKENGLAGITWEGDYVDAPPFKGLDRSRWDEYRHTERRMSAAYDQHLLSELLERHARNERKTPPEDPDFQTSTISGTEYYVKEIPYND